MIIHVENLSKAHLFFCDVLKARPYEHGGHFSHLIFEDQDIILQVGPKRERRYSLSVGLAHWDDLIESFHHQNIQVHISSYEIGAISRKALIKLEDKCEIEILVHSYKI